MSIKCITLSHSEKIKLRRVIAQTEKTINNYISSMSIKCITLSHNEKIKFA